MENPYGQYLKNQTYENIIAAAKTLAKINADRGLTGNAEMIFELASRLVNVVERKE